MDNFRIKGVIFDMDNTLFDFLDAKITACKAITEHMEAGEPLELLSFFRRDKYGFEDVENISDYLQEYGKYNEELFRECCIIYEREKIRTIKLYPDVKQTMLELKSMDVSVGILTDADSQNANKRLKRTGLCGCFDSLFTYDMTGWKKPALKPFIYALESMELKASETLFVGDSLRRDIAPSGQIGMLTAHALYGDSNPPEDCCLAGKKPDHVIKSIREVLTIIQSGNRY